MAGHYSLQIRPGFRVIVLNTNYCARLKFWNLYNPIDPANQLKWLIEELLAAEQAGDSVHIVGHVPPDRRECTQAWLYNFLGIVERFEDTIVGQFYGHTHPDELRVLYSNHNHSKPIGFAFVAPSLTTYPVFNPAYRLYETDTKGTIIDVNTYYLNLTKANQISDSQPETPVWKHEYSMSKTYSLNNFTMEGFLKLIQNLNTRDTYLQLYYRYYYRMSDAMNSSYCGDDCKKSLIKDIIVADAYGPQPNDTQMLVISSFCLSLCLGLTWILGL